MPWEIWLGIGVVIGVKLWRRTFRRIIEEFEVADGAGMVLILLLTCLTFSVWGFALMIGDACGSPDWDNVAKVIAGEPRAIRKARQREQRETQLRQRIVELERELEIDR